MFGVILLFGCVAGAPSSAEPRQAARAAAPVAYKQVVVGNTQACALREDGGVECWGATEEEIEIGTLDIYYHDGATPTGSFERIDLSGMGRSGRPINSASGRACAIEQGSMAICCWGRAGFGLLANKTCIQMLSLIHI